MSRKRTVLGLVGGIVVAIVVAGCAAEMEEGVADTESGEVTVETTFEDGAVEVQEGYGEIETRVETDPAGGGAPADVADPTGATGNWPPPPSDPDPDDSRPPTDRP